MSWKDLSGPSEYRKRRRSHWIESYHQIIFHHTWLETRLWAPQRCKWSVDTCPSNHGGTSMTWSWCYPHVSYIEPHLRGTGRVLVYTTLATWVVHVWFIAFYILDFDMVHVFQVKQTDFIMIFAFMLKIDI